MEFYRSIIECQMERKLTYTCVESAQMRDLLANCITNIFINNTICKYLAIDGFEAELQIVNVCNNDMPKLPQIKMAYDIWGRMELADRHAVLGKFYCLYAGLSTKPPANRRTFIFCALFIHEFTAIFAEAMQWPD
jgi:hypothetical protein